ncbi:MULTISPECIES: transcriptional regulator [Clostridium]|uniref:Transcriptional regulator-like protein n=4 Tax=Clostridium TaxID=1485 RepID=D8GPJ1_CLOLD|nr:MULTISPECIES: transcriptional regulator [Clostridium]ADK13900.1 transcriptional regulator-like protein [Clostridium ljungdahlii DSM 13528]AGY77132.1 hypothetical protein CAETHG_2927 [Clostridium autoethanogenum DSM 10061]ALU37273.1 Transcriptional regulator-like protein [Clostridium autoethanogenum DSM 10061]OAA87390.1 hypothetical protein WX45_03510 [Clostridium ljungdahlii DSM 13528]OAA92461.1 hypothetical protein WX73_00940 [Clostridium coskatii]
MDQLTKLFTKTNSIVWKGLLLVLLNGTRTYLTVRLGLLKLFKLSIFEKNEYEDNEKGDAISFAVL